MLSNINKSYILLSIIEPHSKGKSLFIIIYMITAVQLADVKVYVFAYHFSLFFYLISHYAEYIT
jgi:hypothetical protein